MQAFAQKCQHAQPPLTVILARVLHGERGFSIELRHEFKRQAALLDVAGVLGRIERDVHVELPLQRKTMRVNKYLL